MTDLILFVIASGGGWYVWTSRIRRTKPCRECGGFGYKTKRTILGSDSVRECGTCEGQGRVLRLTARHVQRRKAVRAAHSARGARQARNAARDARAEREAVSPR